MSTVNCREYFLTSSRVCQLVHLHTDTLSSNDSIEGNADWKMQSSVFLPLSAGTATIQSGDHESYQIRGKQLQHTNYASHNLGFPVP